MNVQELEPIVIGRQDEVICRATVDRVPHTRLKDIVDRYAAVTLGQPNLGSFLSKVVRDKLPGSAVKIGRRELKDWGWYIKDDSINDLEVIIQDPAVIKEATQSFHAVRQSKRITEGAATLNAITHVVAAQPAYEAIVGLRIPGHPESPITAANVPLGNGKLLEMAFYNGAVYVGANDFLLLARPSCMTPGKSAKTFDETFPGVIIRLNRPGRSKPRYFIPATRLPELVTLAIQTGEDRAHADEQVASVIAAGSLWAVTVAPAPLPEPEPVAEPAPKPEAPIADDAERKAEAFRRAVRELPGRFSVLEERFAQVEAALPSAGMFAELLENQRKIMADHSTLLAVLGGMAHGAVDALNAAKKS